MTKFLTGIIMVLFSIIILQRSCNKPSLTPEPSVITKHDTAYITKDTTIVKKTTLVKRDTLYRPGDPVFIPDTNYYKLRLQYLHIVKEYTTRNIYTDTLLLDSLGTVVLHDTVHLNKLQQRTYKLSYKIPVITKTITQPIRRQLFIGGGISISTSFTEPTANLGLLYKNKKENIFGVYTLVNGQSKPQIGVSSYWKLSLKK